jgi:hypothetical protein
VGDVGRSEFNSVASLLEVGLIHLLLAHASPRPEPVGHWRSEARTALAGAARRYPPSMGPRHGPAARPGRNLVPRCGRSAR